MKMCMSNVEKGSNSSAYMTAVRVSHLADSQRVTCAPLTYSRTLLHSQNLNNALNHSVLKEKCAVPSVATSGLVTASNGCSGIRGGREGLGMYVATGQSSSCGPSCGILEHETTSTTSDRGACKHVRLCRTWALIYKKLQCPD
jgi:hypothetical protein